MSVALIAVGVVSAVYGALILATRTGSRFYRVWLGIGGTALALGLLQPPGIQSTLEAATGTGVADISHAVATILGIALLVVLLAFVLLSVRIMAAAHDTAPTNLDYVIVLGAQVYRNGRPSRVLEYRLRAALTYLQDNPETQVVVSGGQGPNEPCTEASAMASWLVNHGIGSNRIILEGQSTTTAENLSFSLKAIKAARGSQASAAANAHLRIGMVTNRFHVYRALRIARHQGMSPVWAIPAPSTAWRLPHNLLRECLGVIKNTLAGRM